MTKKRFVGFLLIVTLLLVTISAFASEVTLYFNGFAELENTYGVYQQWPAFAKVQLVDLMINCGILTDENWSQEQSEADQESLAETLLTNHFSSMDYMDTYNVMVYELGQIETWTEEERALYTSLMQKYGQQRADWPVFSVPTGRDLTREEAVQLAKDAVLSIFSVSEEAVDQLVIDAIFATDAYNEWGAPTDEPYWLVSFGYGMAYHVGMTSTGEILGLSAPASPILVWGMNLMETATLATPSTHDITKDVAINKAQAILTEVIGLSYEEVEQMNASSQFFYHKRYCRGEEPVWLVSFSQNNVLKWRILLGYDGSYIDSEPAGKEFDTVLRNVTSLADLYSAENQKLGITEPNINADGDHYYQWSLEEKKKYYDTWVDFANDYKASQPYFVGLGSSEVWEWTRNKSDIPNEQAITQDEALKNAQDAVQQTFQNQPDTDYVSVFYYTTNPEHPEWRFAFGMYYVSIDAYTGDVLMVKNNDSYTIDDFVTQVISN